MSEYVSKPFPSIWRTHRKNPVELDDEEFSDPGALWDSYLATEPGSAEAAAAMERIKGEVQR